MGFRTPSFVGLIRRSLSGMLQITENESWGSKILWFVIDDPLKPRVLAVFLIFSW